MSQQSDLSVFELQYRRTFEAAECNTQVELAEVLGVRQSSISDAKRRQSIPAEWLITLFSKKRVSPEWVLPGEGGKYLMPTDAEQDKLHVVRVLEVRPPQSCSAQELFSELVRRALQEPNFEAIRQDVADTWVKMEKTRPRRRARRKL